MKRFDMTISKCRLLLAILAAVCLSGCDDVFPEADDGSGFFLEETTKKEEAIRFIKTDFSPDYKTFCLTAEVAHDLGPYSLTDTSLVRVKVRETVNGIDVPSPARSRLTSIVNVEGDIIYKTKLKMLAVVDLTLPQEMIDMEYKNVIMASSSFTHDNLYLAFMYGDYLSETMPASDYVLENYFVHQDYDYKYLFRSVLDKHDEMVQRTGPWADAKAMLLVVMSDGKVYFDDDRPMDPLHYQLQEKLIYLGYLDPQYENGTYGNQTLDAVRAFQASAGLSATGFANRVTQQQLDEACLIKYEADPSTWTVTDDD